MQTHAHTHTHTHTYTRAWCHVPTAAAAACLSAMSATFSLMTAAQEPNVRQQVADVLTEYFQHCTQNTYVRGVRCTASRVWPWHRV